MCWIKPWPKDFKFINSFSYHSHVMLPRQLRGRLHPMGSLLTEKWWANSIRSSLGLWECGGRQKGQVTQAQPDSPVTLGPCSHRVQSQKPWDPWNKSSSPNTTWAGLLLATWKRCTNKTHKSQVMLDSLSSAACRAICKKNVGHVKLNSISEFALIVLFSAEHCASHLRSINTLNEWVSCLNSTFKFNTPNTIILWTSRDTQYSFTTQS